MNIFIVSLVVKNGIRAGEVSILTTSQGTKGVIDTMGGVVDSNEV